jgi:predicted Zn-dependent peptidase
MELDEILGIEPLPWSGGVSVLVVVGDLREEQVRSLAEKAFAGVTPESAAPEPVELTEKTRVADLGLAKAQAQIGYVVPAPSPAEPDYWAWRTLLYILSHGYEGRLGKEAISRRGLVYYIDGRYLTDGASGSVTLQIGVDPTKLEAMRTLLDETLEGLRRNPPTGAELIEAKRHFLGRRTTAAQSNREVSGRLALDWVGWGRLSTEAEIRALVNRVTVDDLVRVSAEFTSGAIVIVRVDPR